MKTTKEVSSCGCAFSVLRQSKVSLTRIEGSGSEERSHHHPPHFPVHPCPGHCLRTRQEQRRGFSVWHWRPHCFRTSFGCLPSTPDQDKRLVVGLSEFKQRIKLYSEGPWRGMWWCCPHHVRDLNSSSGSALFTTEWVELRTYLAGGWAMPPNFSKSGDPLWLRLFGYITSTILLTAYKDI